MTGDGCVAGVEAAAISCHHHEHQLRDTQRDVQEVAKSYCAESCHCQTCIMCMGGCACVVRACHMTRVTCVSHDTGHVSRGECSVATELSARF